MKPNSYKVFEMCIENGVKLGLNKAFKHDDNPDRETMENYITSCILQEIDEWFEEDNNER